MVKKYWATFDLIALAQLSALDEDGRNASALNEITALAEVYKACGPITFSPYFDSRAMVDAGPFTCGHAFELELGPLLITITITRDNQELIVRDICVRDLLQR